MKPREEERFVPRQVSNRLNRTHARCCRAITVLTARLCLLSSLSLSLSLPPSVLQVELIIRDIMDKKLKKAKFDDQKCKVLALELCTEIKEKVKDLNIPRYKVVLQSVIGEVKGQTKHNRKHREQPAVAASARKHTLNLRCAHALLSACRFAFSLPSAGQGAYIASRCLWDTETDNYSSFSMKNVSAHAKHMRMRRRGACVKWALTTFFLCSARLFLFLHSLHCSAC